MTPVLDSSSCLIMLWKDGDWHISQKSGPGPFDRGFTLGDGLFETLLWYEKGIHRLAEHHRRLSQSAHSLGFPPPPSVEVLANLSQKLALARTIEGKGALRLSLSRGAGQRGLSPPPTPSAVLVLTLQEIEEHTGGTQLSTVSLRRNPQSITSHHKTLSYLDNVMAHREAHQKGAMEALMLNTKGNLTCAAAANLFWSHGRKLYTPALEEGALPGITRSFVLQTAPGAGFDVKEGAWPPSVLLAAECVFLTNSLIGLREVESLDGVQLSCNLSVVEALRKTGFSL